MSAAGPLSTNRPERVAVVIPAKDEAERIERTILAARAIDGVDMVVVVDDGSADATAALAKGAGALVVRHRTNRGKAAAMATGAQVVAIREDADRADGGSGRPERESTEERSAGHTGPLPVIDADWVPRALLFLDADMGDSATAAQPLVEAVLEDGVDMAIALLPPQVGAGGMGVVVRTARKGIRRATGWEPQQPLSGTRCITRETWDACQPLAAGWGVETSLTIDALDGGFWVKEVDCDLHHRATGNDLAGRLHRAAQLRDVVRALARRRHVTPDAILEDEQEVPAGSERPTEVVGAEPDGPAIDDASPERDADPVEHPADPAPAPAPEQGDETPTAGEPSDRDEPADSAPAEPVGRDEPADSESTEPVGWGAERDAEIAARRRAALVDLPVEGEFSDDQLRAIGDVDGSAFARRLLALPVEGAYGPDDIVLLASSDLKGLAARMRRAPVVGSFRPEHAVILAAHDDIEEVDVPAGVTDLTADEYVSLVIHAAVDAENRER